MKYPLLAVITFSISSHAFGAGAADAITEAVEHVLGVNWIPIIPPDENYAIGSSAVVRDKAVALICGSKNDFLHTSPVYSSVDIVISLSGGAAVDVSIGKLIKKWLVDIGLLSEFNKLEKIHLTVDEVINNEITTLELRRQVESWSDDCKEEVINEWKPLSDKPFSIIGVSYWKNTRIRGYDKNGAAISIGLDANKIGSTKISSMIELEGRYSLSMPGKRLIAIRPWKLRKRAIGLGPSIHRVEMSSRDFSPEEINSIYNILTE